MGLLDILQQYAGGAAPAGANVNAHFDQAAQQTSPQALGNSIAAAFRSDATPPFGQMVGELFNRSNPQLQAGLLNQLIQAIGPAALSSIGGGSLGGVLGSVLGGTAQPSAGATPSVSATQAQQVSPEDIAAAAAHAEKQDPTIIDRLGQFYAQHPDLVKGLGATALAIALGHLHSQR